VDFKKSFEHFKIASLCGDLLASEKFEEFKGGDLLASLLVQEWPVSNLFLNENCKVAMKEIFLATEMSIPIPKEVLYIVFKLLIKMWPPAEPHTPYT